MSPQGVYAMNLLSTETRGDGKGKRIRQENNEGDCPNHDTADGKVQSTALALKNLKRGGKLSVSMWRTRLLIHSKEGKRAVRYRRLLGFRYHQKEIFMNSLHTVSIDYLFCGIQYTPTS